MKKILLLFTCIFALAGLVNASNTGKITGVVTDSKTGDAVIGANVIVLGTHYGAATDLDGKYSIYNVPPGEYKLVISSIGYQRVTVSKVVVKINLTTRQDIKMQTEDILSEEIVVEAEAPLVQKDLTSTSVTVTASDIKAMPVENLSQVVNMQAGVVDGHFRGGRSNEVGYLVDGVPVNDVYNNSVAVGVENASIRQLEVISGAFNAEYGRAMSGMVNIVTQDGSLENYESNYSVTLGNYYSSDTKIFRNLDKPFNVATKDYSATVSGPIPFISDVSFFITGRYYDDQGYFWGRRIYNIADTDSIKSFRANSGDKKWMPMQTSKKLSLSPKITWSGQSFKVSYSLFYDDNENQYYSHDWSYSPDGRLTHYRTNYVNTLKITHFPTSSTFHELSLGANIHRYKGYLYEDEYDSRYIDPNVGASFGSYAFRYGGNDGSRYERYTNSYLIKWQLTSQLTDKHKLGMGAEVRFHELFDHGKSIQASSSSDSAFVINYAPLHFGGNQQYHENPMEFAIYLQDKMEYDMMIINAGLRYEFFDPRSRMPADLNNPQINPLYPGGWVDSKPSSQLSPRLGVSFPISDRGVLHFSYGHFFQPPSFQQTYLNHEYNINGGNGVNTQVGNANLKPESTTSYEFGLQQMISDDAGFETTIYYRDIRNLIGGEILRTYDGLYYSRYINRDYGNVKGLIVSLNYRLAKMLKLKSDYTYQIAEGNSSNPDQVFQAARDNARFIEKHVTPLNWDQRHTFNLSAIVNDETFGMLSFIFGYGSGNPYTEDVRHTGGMTVSNGGTKPSTYSFDFRYDKGIEISGYRVNLFALVYNVFNIKNEYGVFASTGRATEDIEANRQIATDYTVAGYNTIKDYINDPTRYSGPRTIKLGLNFSL
ncbi:MAG: TonB-dependent receptor [Bacteroidetes bacterium]|nr:TonB-dependent receptor [Bacteroidota bacterium]